MIYIATNISNEEINLGPAYSYEIDKSKDTPADSLLIKFPCNKNHEEYKFIDVYINETEKIFSGIVDEQKIEVSNNGCILTIKARNKAAYLIDNEANVQIYKRPSLDIIFERHVKPYGFESITGDKSTFNVMLEVTENMSEWDVLEQFCSTCLGTFPIINLDNTIDATGLSSSEEIIFSNFDNNTKYSSISYSLNRHKLISEIIVCAAYEPIFVAKVTNQEAINKGISRKKYISMSTDEDLAKQTSISVAEQSIFSAQKESREFNITCPGTILTQLSTKCSINDQILGKIENLEIYEINYILNQNGEFTLFTLLET